MKIENSDDFKNVKIEYQSIVEFNFEEDNYSVFYSEDDQVWFAEHFDLKLEVSQNIEIIEDKKNEIIMDKDIYLFDMYLFTVEKLNEFKKIINL